MKLGKLLVAALVTQSVALLTAGAASADVIYTYTGNDFGGGGGTVNSPYTTSDKITGTVTLSGALGDSLSNSTVSPVAYSFSDGIVTLTSPACCNTSTQTEFVFSTDASGNITHWTVIVQANGNTTEIETTDPSMGTAFDETTAKNVLGAENLSDPPGTWKSATVTTSVPEPASLALLGSGLLGLAFFYRRKRA
jgi:PEP-CTERM motif